MSMTAIFLCNRTPIMYQPWLDAGYEVWTVDLGFHADMHSDRLHQIRADVRDWWPPLDVAKRCEFACAFPPCTDLAVSGARWFASKGLRSLSDAIDTFGACVNLVEWLGVPGFVENPVSVISSHYRKPDFTFDPCDYGDPYTKKTCLWAFGGFQMPPMTPVPATQGSKMHLMPPSADRADKRSETPRGFAEAVFRAYGQTRQEAA